MYSTHNEGKSVVEGFMGTSKAKNYKKMTANDSKSSLGYLNNQANEFNKSHHRSIDEKLVDADYSALTKEIELSHEAPKFKASGRVRIAKYQNIFSKDYTENCSIEIFAIDSVLKTHLCTYKIKDLKGDKIIGSFYEK